MLLKMSNIFRTSMSDIFVGGGGGCVCVWGGGGNARNRVNPD